MASSGSYCYHCSRFDSISCPHCYGSFHEPLDFTSSVSSLHRSPTRFPPPSMQASTAAAVTRTRSPESEIVLRGSEPSDVSQRLDRSALQMYYDDGSDLGFRPFTSSMTEFLLGSRFDRLLDQISQIELNTNRSNHSYEHPPASKSAIKALPVIEIDRSHLRSDFQSHCAVCKENFILKSVAREMPCNHIYHPDCILPWLAIRNSCPVCRHELPAEDINDVNGTHPIAAVEHEEEEEDSAAGLTIWRLPGGGFAVGRMTESWRGRDRVVPVVYTEVNVGRIREQRLPRRVAWSSRREGSRESVGGFSGRVMRLFGCFSGSSRSGLQSRVSRRSRSSLYRFNTTSSASSRRNRL